MTEETLADVKASLEWIASLDDFTDEDNARGVTGALASNDLGLGRRGVRANKCTPGASC
jgi:hypothetical protein